MAKAPTRAAPKLEPLRARAPARARPEVRSWLQGFLLE
jgi:hypothetical protein